jgi:hypothetical protein
MQTQEFYRYEDAQGKIVIVDSLSRVPEAQRAKAERLTFSAPKPPEPPLPAKAREFTIDWLSFGAGFGSAALIVLLFVGMRRLSSPLARVAIVLVGAALLAGAYLGLLRQTTGQSGSPLASPSAVIDDARRAVDAANHRKQRQEQQIDEILRTK